MDWLSKIVKARFFYAGIGLNFVFSDCVAGIWKQLCEQIENSEINGPSFEGVVKKIKEAVPLPGGI